MDVVLRLTFVFISLFITQLTWGKITSKNADEIQIIEELTTSNFLDYGIEHQAEFKTNSELKLLYQIKASDLEGNKIRRLELLTQLSDNPNTGTLVNIWANYHLGCYIKDFGLVQEAEAYFKQAILKFNLISDHKLKFFVYRELAGIYYDHKNYKEALNLYKKCLTVKAQLQDYERASTLNNIGLTYQHIGNYNESLVNYNTGLTYVVKRTNEFEKEVYYLIQGNIGGVYYEEKKYDLALKYILLETNYLESQKNYNYFVDQAYLISIYHAQGKSYKHEFSELLKSYDAIDDIALKFKLYNVILDNNIDLISANEQNQLYVMGRKITREYLDFVDEKRKEIVSILFVDKLNQLSTIGEQERQKLSEEARNNRIKTILIFLILFAFATIFIAFLKIKKQNKIQSKQNTIIQNQTNQLLAANKQLLENEIKQQQEQLNALSLNLKVKKETEENFLQTIKALRKRNDLTIDEVIKEIQLNISNSKGIDRKLNFTASQDNSTAVLLTAKLKVKFPTLSQMELEHCHYYAFDLSAKEIGQITGQSEGAVRVFKNKIKNKIGLQKEDDLNLFLKKEISNITNE